MDGHTLIDIGDKRDGSSVNIPKLSRRPIVMLSRSALASLLIKEHNSDSDIGHTTRLVGKKSSRLDG